MNVLTIKRNVEGLPVALRLQAGKWTDATIAFYAATLGELTDGAVDISWGEGNRQNFPLDTHADDNGVAGATAYAELVRLTTHTEHPHTDISPAKSLGERINGALLSIANIFSRLEKLENPPVAMFPKWKLKNGVIRGTAGERDKTICKYDLANGNYRFCQTPFNPENVDDARQIMTIKTQGLGDLVFLTANSGEIARIEDALEAGTDIDSIPHTAPPTGAT